MKHKHTPRKKRGKCKQKAKNNERIERVSSITVEDIKCSIEMRTRIAIAKGAFNNKKNFGAARLVG